MDDNQSGKIGQVTLWNYNYGSVLQCFATQQLMRERGYRCVLINRKENHFGFFIFAIQYIVNCYIKYLCYPKYISKFRALKAATKKKSDNSLSQFNLNKINEFIKNEIETQNYTYKQLKQVARSKSFVLFLSGSDQVWNGSWFIKNKMYFLRFAPKPKRIAFAPSFGTEEIAEYNIKRYKKYIGEYARLSARETQGAEIIRQLTGREAKVVLDPTLQLDAAEWRMRLKEKQPVCKPDGKYIFLYFLNKPSALAVETIAEIKRQTGWTVVSLAYRYDELSAIEGIIYTDGGPWDFVSLADEAEFVCTDSFHAIAFAMTFNVPFFVFKRQYAHDSDQTSRITSILNLCGVPERLITKRIDLVSDYIQMDFTKINLSLERERASSLMYIQDCLDSIITVDQTKTTKESL